MNAKLVRRLLKLDISTDGHPELNFVKYVVEDSTRLLYTGWSLIMAQDGPRSDLPHLKSLEFSHDVFYSLPTLDENLDLITDGKNSNGRFSQHPTLLNTKQKSFQWI